jgi:hypothetical protein
MKIRTVLAGSTTLAVVGLAAATLAPVSSQAAIVKASKTAGCSVTVDGPNTTGTLTAPVIKSVMVANDATNPAYVSTLGYYAQKTYYAGSAALATNLSFSSPGAACGSVSTVMYGVHNGTVDASPLETRTASLVGLTSPTTINSLVADVSPGNDSNTNGPCLGLQLEVRDTNGTIVQLAPSTGPELQCPGQGGGFSFGG